MKPALLTLLLLGSLAAQGPPPLPDPNGPKTPVSGRILTGGNRPVRGAKVLLQAMGGSELGAAFSDGDGRWQIPEAPVGDFFVRVEKSGYAGAGHGILIPSSDKLEGVDISIDRYAVVTGRVTDHRGRPIVGARVELLTEQPSEDGIRYPLVDLNGMDRQQTDDRGIYRIWGLTPGRYRIAVMPPQALPAAGVVRLESAPAFYPGGLIVDEAEPVELGWGDVREGLDVRLPEAANTQLDVTMSFDQGPCPRCYLQVAGSGPTASLTDGRGGGAPDGVYRIEGLPAGEYRLLARGTLEEPRLELQGLEPVRITEGQAQSAHVPLAQPAPLKVRVVLEDPPDDLLAEGAKPWRMLLRLEPAPEDRKLLARGREMEGRIESTEREAIVEMVTLPGRRRLEIWNPPGAVAGVALDGRPLDSPWLDPPPEGFSGELTIRLRFDIGLIEGRLNQAQTDPSAGLQDDGPMILWESASHAPSFLPVHFRSVREGGTFSFALAPGVYNLAPIKRELIGGDPRSRTFTAEDRKRLKRVEVKAGQTTQVTLDAPD